MDEDILVAEEVASLIRVDRQRVYELCRTDPTFPVILVGQRQYRFSKNSVSKWLADGGSQKREGDTK